MTTEATTNADSLAAMLEQIGQGDMLGAFETYYHDDVVMHDPHAGTVAGKDTNRAREEAFVAMIASVEAFETGPVLSGGNQTAYQNRFAFTNTEGQQFDMLQVAVQTWQDGKIIEERFFPAAS